MSIYSDNHNDEHDGYRRRYKGPAAQMQEHGSLSPAVADGSESSLAGAIGTGIALPDSTQSIIESDIRFYDTVYGGSNGEWPLRYHSLEMASMHNPDWWRLKRFDLGKWKKALISDAVIDSHHSHPGHEAGCPLVSSLPAFSWLWRRLAMMVSIIGMEPESASTGMMVPMVSSETDRRNEALTMLDGVRLTLDSYPLARKRAIMGTVLGDTRLESISEWVDPRAGMAWSEMMNMRGHAMEDDTAHGDGGLMGKWDIWMDVLRDRLRPLCIDDAQSVVLDAVQDGGMIDVMAFFQSLGRMPVHDFVEVMGIPHGVESSQDGYDGNMVDAGTVPVVPDASMKTGLFESIPGDLESIAAALGMVLDIMGNNTDLLEDAVMLLCSSLETDTMATV